MTIVTTTTRCLLGGLIALAAAACAPGATHSGAAPEPEMVQIGYGEAERENLTGSVSSITEKDIGQLRFARIEDMLQGRASGVQVLRASNGQISLRIRGVTSINGNNEPLVIIDGMPVRPFGLGGALASINPQDVRRIDVLKDAGSTAIYGARGANGVLVITTKRTR